MKKLAVLGPAGTYSALAATLLKDSYDIDYTPTILKVCSIVDEEKDGLIPFENTLDGYVMEGLDAIIKNKLFICEQVFYDVNFSFIAHTKNLSKIKEVYVQYKAYGQCIDFITKHNLIPRITQSNMESYDKFKMNIEESVGAIVPIHVDKKEFELCIDYIADSRVDQTRFVRLSKERKIYLPVANSCCSAIITPILDSPGVLFDILEAFKENKINLCSILSRPRRDLMGNYIFYVEFDIKPHEFNILEVLKKRLEYNQKNSFTVIGIYNKVEVKK